MSQAAIGVKFRFTFSSKLKVTLFLTTFVTFLKGSVPKFGYVSYESKPKTLRFHSR